jgi:hypothetical protein
MVICSSGMGHNRTQRPSRGLNGCRGNFPLSQSRESPPGGRVCELRDGETNRAGRVRQKVSVAVTTAAAINHTAQVHDRKEHQLTHQHDGAPGVHIRIDVILKPGQMSNG